MHRDIVGPHEMQQEYGLIGGNIFHGELTPEQLFHMRPAPGLRRLPHPDRRPLQRQLGDARRRRRLRDPGLAGGQGRDRTTSRSTRLREEMRASRWARSVFTTIGRRCARCSRPAPSPSSAPARAPAASASGWSARRCARPASSSVCTWSTRRTTRWPAGRASRTCRPSTRHPTWCCSGSATSPLVEQLAAAAEVGARSARSSSAALTATACATSCAPSPPRPGWPLCGAGCMGFWNVRRGLRAMGYVEREDSSPSARSRWSPTRARCSPRCCGPGAGWASTSRLVRPGAGHHHRRLRRPRRRRHRHPAAGAGAGDRPRRPPAALRRCAGAREAGIEVVLLPVGGSPLGAAMVAAHSGAVAGDDATWEALCDDVTGSISGPRPRRAGRHPGAARRSDGGRARRGAGWRPSTTPAPSAPWWPTSPTSTAYPSPRSRRTPLTRSPPARRGPGRGATRSTSGAAARTPASCSAPAWPRWPPTPRSG